MVLFMCTCPWCTGGIPLVLLALLLGIMGAELSESLTDSLNCSLVHDHLIHIKWLTDQVLFEYHLIGQ